MRCSRCKEEKPAAEWKNADVTLTLEYDARPDSEQNLMFDFDAKGQLTAIRPVITLENMALLRTGRINSAAPIIALQWLELNRTQLLARWGLVAP